jgi:hypothetical protein
MMQLKYRNFGAFEAMVVNQTIDSAAASLSSSGSRPLRKSPEFDGISFKDPEETGPSISRARSPRSPWAQ